ncbi:hypothetical protein RIF25_14410 [Thermosynechococcaceae cyanobacterium BACA0444]|uniref:Uncharacterized protein n=1 Tax=Pseudocalidococcus azoricus BACA0444 TaxID=2918990 RepID=A0AAE4FTF2_9CYAN|nr:hypothetical protein [Pseudocalidococcus azoricus]MDS3861993.1 hypothetical protein [Pseudocalidococcus azoricus BACA0444]
MSSRYPNLTMNPEKSTRLQLSLVLLAIMLIAGSLSTLGGYFFGRESLRGVTQPVVNPILGDVSSEAETSSPRQTFLKESDIITQAEGITTNRPRPAQPTASVTPTPTQSPGNAEAPGAAGFPKVVTVEGVKLAVNSVSQVNGDLVLGVTLSNQSPVNVQFIYTYLDIMSDQGTPLIAITKGLPTEVPAKGESYSGTIHIPLTSLAEVKTLNLSLTDFPNQDIKLSIKDIPVEP